MSNPFDGLGDLCGSPAPAAAPPAVAAAPGNEKQPPAPAAAMGAPQAPAPMGAPADPWAPVAPSPAPAAPAPPAPAAAPLAAPPVPPAADPWGAPPTAAAPPVAPPAAAPGAMVPSTASNPDPFGVGAIGAAAAPPAPFGAPAPAAPAPFGAAPAAPAPVAPGALVPSAMPNDDPFGIFMNAPARAASPPPGAVVPANANAYASPPSSPISHPYVNVAGYDYPDSPPPQPPTDAGADNDDFWASMGLAAPAPAAAAPAAPPPASERKPVGASVVHGTAHVGNGSAHGAAPQARGRDQERDRGEPELQTEVRVDEEGLPVGGEKYTARIQAPSLGVIFFTAAELLPSVYSRIESRQPIDVLESRPVVGHCFDGGAALAAGIMPGHVLLSVNGRKVSDPVEAKGAIREGSRPLSLEFYILPERAYPVTFAEGRHMVKYDTPDEGAPSSQWEWKPKYVVIGGIIAKPWMIMMYRSRAEYDAAVKSVMSDRSPTVKIKQFSLLGAQIYHDEMTPLEVRRNLWYISVIPRRGYPIKISSRDPEDLMPVLEGCRMVLRNRREGRYDERMSLGERNLSHLDDYRRRHNPRSGSHLNFYDRPGMEGGSMRQSWMAAGASVHTVGSY